MGRATVVVLDAEDSVLEAVRDVLADAETDVVVRSRDRFSPQAVLDECPSVLVAGVRSLGDDPASWIAGAARTCPALVVILLGAPGDLSPSPVPEAFDVLGHPPCAAALRRACRRALDHHRLLRRLHELGRTFESASPPGEDLAAADRRFRDAKRTVVDAFEQAYLADLLRRYRGNVTAAASHSGMLRSALQRLLRKHDLRSSEFRLQERSGVRERTN